MTTPDDPRVEVLAAFIGRSFPDDPRWRQPRTRDDRPPRFTTAEMAIAILDAVDAVDPYRVPFAELNATADDRTGGQTPP